MGENKKYKIIKTIQAVNGPIINIIEEEKSCLGFNFYGQRCKKSALSGENFCNYHHPKHATSTLIATSRIRKTKCQQCDEPGLLGINSCYEHLPQEPDECEICTETKKLRITNCQHELCYDCFERLDFCPFCRDNLKSHIRESVIIPKPDIDIINSIFMIRDKSRNDQQFDILTDLAFCILNKYKYEN